MEKMKRLNFEVSNYDLIEMAESEIMKVKMYIVSEGNNAHNMPISWEAIQKAKSTLIGKPIVAKYDKWGNDLMGHEEDEIPIGVVLNEADLFEEEIDGKRWLGAYGDIWMRYTQDISGVLVRDMVKNLSMEILVAEESDMGDIMAFAFTGVTLIGANKNPAIKNAKVEVLTFETVKNEIEKRIFSSDEASSQFKLSDGDIEELADKLYKKFQEKDGERMDDNVKNDEVKVYLDDNEDVKMSEIPDESKEVEMACGDKMEEDEGSEVEMEAEEKPSEEKMEAEGEKEVKEEKMTDAYAENSAIEQNQERVAEEQREQAEEQNEPEMMEIEKSKYEYYIQLEQDFEEMKSKYEAMEKDKDAYMEATKDYEALKEFKANYDLAKFNAEVEATFAEVLDDMPKDVIDEFRKSASNFTIETLGEWKNQVLASAFSYSKGKTEKKHMSIDILTDDIDTKKKSKGLWD